MRSYKKYFPFIPGVLLATIYVIHGLQALLISQDMLILFSVFSFPMIAKKILLVLVGLVDILIAYLVTKRPSIPILIYAALWPVVPVTLAFITIGSGEFSEILTTSILAYAIYYLRIRKA